MFPPFFVQTYKGWYYTGLSGSLLRIPLRFTETWESSLTSTDMKDPHE